VYYAEGEIVDQAGSSALGGGETQIVGNEVIKDLRKLQEDDDVKAVVLRVNSPGGSAFASEQIWHAVTELKAKKPVIVSMGDYAASGGYYISCNADTIVAEPTTLTGSIGIFGLVPYVEKLTKKIGVAADVVKTNEFADFGDLTRPMNSAEQQKMQANVERGYDLFLTRCADGRGKTKEEIDQVGQGRVWTGSMAIDLGLVDVLGGLDTALDIAIEKAGVEAYTIQNYPGEKSFIETLMESTSKGMDAYIRTRVMGKTLNEVSKHFYLIDELDKVDPVQARMPFIVNFN
jgi:protease-4